MSGVAVCQLVRRGTRGRYRGSSSDMALRLTEKRQRKPVRRSQMCRTGQYAFRQPAPALVSQGRRRCLRLGGAPG
jgi:hypothetical protein